MAETAIGTHSQDHLSEWAQFDFGPLGQAYPGQDTELQSNGNLPHYPQHLYDGLHKDASDLLNESQIHHHFPDPSSSTMLYGPVGSDGGCQPHLTQDQLAALENSFAAAPKPKNDYKRGLAEKLGLDLPRVNNWFQNRRQKARPQNFHGKQSSDATSNDAPSTTFVQPMSTLISETQILNDPFSDQQHLQGPGTFSYDFNTKDYASQYQNESVQSHSAGQYFSHSVDNGPPAAFQDKSICGPSWVNDLHQVPTSQSFTVQENYYQGTSMALSPPTLPASHAFPATLDGGPREYVSPISLQNHQSPNEISEEPSSLNLNCHPASTGDGSHLMTPPDHTPPPMPWLTSEYENRRTSDSSELAHNVEGLHLQQSTSGLAMASTSFGPSSHSSVLSTNGIGTPDTSPEQTVGKPIVPATDLASRRKRHGPAALRPESNRSVSFAGPPTNSPHSRHSSISAGQSGQVRRIQSSSQLPTKDQFRIQKTTNSSMQISPRNLQKHLDKHSLHQSEMRSNTEPHPAAYTGSHHATSKPSASAASANRSPAEYQHEFAVRKNSTSYESSSGSIFQMPHANSSVPNLPSSQHQHPHSIQVPSQQHSQPQVYQGPPLSAPPHQTSFFDDSPAHSGPFQPPNSQSQAFISQDMGFNTPPGHQNTHFTPHPGYLPPFAPQFQFPSEKSPLSRYPGTGFLPSFPPSAPAPPPLDLDIKVELGPEPKLPARFDKCSFNNTFSGTYNQNLDKK